MQAPHAADLEELGLEVSHDMESPWVTTVTAANDIDESITVTWSTQENFAWVELSISETPRVQFYRDEIEDLSFSRDPDGLLHVRITTIWPDLSGCIQVSLGNHIHITDTVARTN